MPKSSKYRELKPVEELTDFIHSFWAHKNLTDKPEQMTIFPDSYFKIVLIVRDQKIISYFMTGLWTDEKPVTVPARATTFGCRFKILAPEFLLNREIASILQKYEQLELQHLNVDTFDLLSFETIVSQWQHELLKRKPSKTISGNKLRLSQLLYKMKGSISATEASEQIYWTNRQINRYLNKYLGVSLKKYLNIQKCYEAYIQIREGKFYPEKDYFDQAHFIKEVKKHTGETPKTLHEKQNDRFIQLKNIKRK